MLGGKIASIGDPIFFSTESFNVKLNGRFISKSTRHFKNLAIDSNYEIVEDILASNIDIEENLEVLFAHYMVTFGTSTNSFPLYSVFFDKQFDIINGITEYLLVQAYIYEKDAIHGTNMSTIPQSTTFAIEAVNAATSSKPNDHYKFINEFLFNKGPYSYDKDTKKYLFLSSNPNILHKYSFANKFKELMDILYSPTEDNDVELQNKILRMFGPGPNAEKSYENLSDLYNVFAKRVTSSEILEKYKEKFNETFIDILGLRPEFGPGSQGESQVSSYLRQDIEEIKMYKKFIKICDLNPSFSTTYGIKLSILFFSVYIQNRLSRGYITRGGIPVELYPINKTNFLLNLLGNINYDGSTRDTFARQLQIKQKPGTSLRENLTSQELLFYGQGLKLYDYSNARFQGIQFPNCVENALVQMIKSFCWTERGYDLEIIRHAKPEFKDFMQEVFTKPNYDNSDDMRDRFAELISVEITDPDKEKFNDDFNSKTYNIKSTYGNFMHFLKRILNGLGMSDQDIFQEIKNSNNFIQDITIAEQKDSRNTYKVNITYKDKLSSLFEIYNGHSKVIVKSTTINISNFRVQERMLFNAFASDLPDQFECFETLYQENDSLDYLSTFVNLIKNKYTGWIHSYITGANIYNICHYLTIVDSIYTLNESYLPLFINFLVKKYFSKGSSSNVNVFENIHRNMPDTNPAAVVKTDLNNLNFTIDPVIYTVMYFLHKIRPIETSGYEYLDKFYKTIVKTLTPTHITQEYIDKQWITDTPVPNHVTINKFFNSFIFFYVFLNSSILESLYKNNFRIILGNQIPSDSNHTYLNINVITANSIFSYLLLMWPNENNVITDPYIDFSVLTYFFKLLLHTSTIQTFTIQTLFFRPGHAQSLTKYYLIKVFDCVIKRQFDNAIFLYGLVKNLTLYCTDKNKVTLINRLLLENFITLNRDLCLEFLTHEYVEDRVDITNFDYSFDYNEIPFNSYDANIPRYSLDLTLKQTLEPKQIREMLARVHFNPDRQFNPSDPSNPTNLLKNDMESYFKVSKSRFQPEPISGGNNKYQKYASKYLNIKKNMDGGKYQLLGINTKPFRSNFPIFIGKRNIIRNTDPNANYEQNYILNNNFELVKLSLVAPDDPLVPYHPIESFDPIKYKKNKSFRDIKRELARPGSNPMFLGIPFSEFEKIIRENPEQEPDPPNIQIYNKMQKFICTNRFKQFMDLVFGTNELAGATASPNAILLITQKDSIKDSIISKYNSGIKPINSSLSNLTRSHQGINFNVDLVPEIVVPDYTIYKQIGDISTNQIKELERTDPIVNVIKSIQKFNGSKFVTIPGDILNRMIGAAKEQARSGLVEFTYPNPDEAQQGQLGIKKKSQPYRININVNNVNLTEMIEQTSDYNFMNNLEIMIKGLYNLFPSLNYYLNLSDTFEYYFNPGIDGNLYIYKQIKELNEYIFDDLQLINLLKSDQAKYSPEFFCHFIKFILNNKFVPEIPINEASLYENLFGLDQGASANPVQAIN